MTKLAPGRPARSGHDRQPLASAFEVTCSSWITMAPSTLTVGLTWGSRPCDQRRFARRAMSIMSAVSASGEN